MYYVIQIQITVQVIVDNTIDIKNDQFADNKFPQKIGTYLPKAASLGLKFIVWLLQYYYVTCGFFFKCILSNT